MHRAIPFLAAAACTYLLSWFLPVIQIVPGLDKVGWQAFQFALSAIWDHRNLSAFDVVLYASCALTNVVIVLSFVSLVARLRVPTPVIVGALVVAATLNLWWFIFAGNERRDLRIGYYLWVFSFACLAVGAQLYPRYMTD